MQLIVKPSIFDRPRPLVIDPNFIEFDDTELINTKPTKFLKEELTGIRYGIKWIRGVYFYIGRVYCIDLKNISGKVIKIRFKSLYGIRRSELNKKYFQIINTLLDFFFDDISRNYLQQFSNNKNFEIAGVKFLIGGVFLDNKTDLISWEDLGTKSYQSYYSLYSISNPNKYKAFEYLTNWNTAILYSVSRQILKNKGLWNE